MIGIKGMKSLTVVAGVLLIAAGSALAGITSDTSGGAGVEDATLGADPTFLFSIDIGGNAASATLNATDLGGGMFLATSGTLIVTTGLDVGTYSLFPGGPAAFFSPSGVIIADNVLYPGSDPLLDVFGLLFTGGGLEINIYGNGPNDYTFASWDGSSLNVFVSGAPDSVSLQVPEPATLALIGIGLAGLGASRRRKLN